MKRRELVRHLLGNRERPASPPAPWHYPLAYSLERESAAQAVSCQEMDVVYNRQSWLSYAGEAHELVPRQVAESVAMERSVGDA